MLLPSRTLPSTPSVGVIATEKPEVRLYFVLPIPDALTDDIQWDEIYHRGSSIPHSKPAAHLSYISLRVATLISKVKVLFPYVFSQYQTYHISTLRSLA